MVTEKFDRIISFIRQHYQQYEGIIHLHEPVFYGNEKAYVNDAIDSTFVSSVGKYVNRLEDMICEYTGSGYAVAMVNGSAALHIGLLVAGVKRGDLVITQPLSFVATCNSINYSGADPLFIDIDDKTLGLSAGMLETFLKNKTKLNDGSCYHIASERRISACIPMNTFGHPAELDKIAELCRAYRLVMLEDAAESIGSKYKNRHTGTYGTLGVYSFNGNKTITSGGGGMLITQNKAMAEAARHLSTQAKVPHPWEFIHDQVGFNYRMPNINAALACAQLENLDLFISNKRNLAGQYEELFLELEIPFIKEPAHSFSNYWLNAILFEDRSERDAFLTYANSRDIKTRPAWTLMTKLNMFRHSVFEDAGKATDIENRLVNLPSSVILQK